MHPLILTGALGALVAATSAQVVSPRQLIGFGSDPAAVASPAILSQTLCQPGVRVCPTGVGPAIGHAGGAAFNALNASLWHTQGTRMAEIRLDGCQLLCSVAANLTLGPGSVATGLEICEARYQMLQLESVPGAAALSFFHLRSCPPQVTATCRFALPSVRHIAGAVALDEAHDLVLYAASIFGAVVPANTLLIARAGSPCDIVCRAPLDNCGLTPLGAITGMTYDACTQLLYVTDGRQTAIFSNRAATSPCDFVPVGCCPRSPGIAGYTWHGLDLEPAHPRAVGTSCLNDRCPDCNTMALTAHGDPALGNPAFRIDLTDAPTGGLFQLGIAAGPCTAGFPIFCGRWHTDITTLVLLPFVPINGSVRCDGTASVGLPVPKDYALCGARLCAQGIVVCPPFALPPSLGLTNALDLVLGT